MEVNIRRQSGTFHMRGTNSEGRSVETDAAVSIGGTNKGVRAMEMVLMALGSCSAVDIIKILEKSKQNLEDIRINIKGERKENAIPSPFIHIHVHYELHGDISPKKADRAVDLSLNKYCSVAHMLRQTAQIEYTFEIVKSPNQ